MAVLTAKASEADSGQLLKIPNASLYIPNAGEIFFYSMPTINDTKGAKYDPAPVIGRSMPILTYAYSEIRQISLDIPFVATNSGGEGTPNSFLYNAQRLRWIASAVYPRNGGTMGCPYRPPVVCVLKFGIFLFRNNAGNQTGSVCVTLDKYSVKNDPQVPSDPKTLVPYKFVVNTQWSVVYANSDLPDQDMIVQLGK